MGATNHTTNYNLSQFIGTDKPSWLNDYNGDMSAIDTGIKAAADAATLAQTTATNAGSTATSAANTASALSTQINTPVTGLAAVVSDHTTNLTNIDNKIGTTPLTTVAQTLTGAIEEVKGSIPSTTGAMKFIESTELSAAFDGTKTYGQALNELYTAFVARFGSLEPNQYIRTVSLSANSSTYPYLPCASALLTSAPASIRAYMLTIGTEVVVHDVTLSASSTFKAALSNNWNPIDNTSSTPASGASKFVFEVYEVEA